MAKYFKVSDENYRKVETVLKRNGITIEGEYMYAIEPFIEEEVKFQIEKFKNNNEELIEGITFDTLQEREAVTYLQSRMQDKSELFIDQEALETITEDFIKNFIEKIK